MNPLDPMTAFPGDVRRSVWALAYVNEWERQSVRQRAGEVMSNCVGEVCVATANVAVLALRTASPETANTAERMFMEVEA